jgi:hypothetical protein
VSGTDPYDEPTYLDWGKWLRIVVAAVSVLALLALLLLAATDEAPSLPDSPPANPTVAPETSATASPSPTTTPTTTATATATPVIAGAASPSPAIPIPALIQTAACTRISCSEFFSRAELDAYLLRCPDDARRFDRDGDGRACWNSADW